MKLVAMAIAVACVLPGCASGDRSLRKAENAGSNRAIGWLHGNCLALAGSKPRIGSQVAVVALGDVQRIVAARITGKAVGADECIPLLDDRRAGNLREGLAFYRIDADAPVELGIGVVQSHADPVPAVSDLLDTNGDGRRDTFSHCATSEGVQFSVWADEARRETPLWSGYYYLGYDTEADCPEGT